jgi:hypothetical protein
MQLRWEHAGSYLLQTDLKYLPVLFQLFGSNTTWLLLGFLIVQTCMYCPDYDPQIFTDQDDISKVPIIGIRRGITLFSRHVVIRLDRLPLHYWAYTMFSGSLPVHHYYDGPNRDRGLLNL